MKLKLKNKMPQAEQKQATKSSLSVQNSSWEMSAQAALRVDYVTRSRSLPLNHN